MRAAAADVFCVFEALGVGWAIQKSALIKRNENSDSHPLSARAPDREEN